MSGSAGVHDAGPDLARFPTLSAEGARLLELMREHPAAPLYRNHSGNKLLASEVAYLRRFEAEVLAAPVGWQDGGHPAWLAGLVDSVFRDVPYYRALGRRPAAFEDIAPVRRADLAADIAAFVPDHVDIARMIAFNTSGTTGHPMLVPSHPLVAGSYLAFHKRALARFGAVPTYGAGQVGVMLLGCQQRCFTYVSVTPTMGESGLAKINLHPDDWRDAADRARYLDAMAPEILAGDPVSFAELLNLPVTLRPRALISVSMMLLPGLRQRLEQRFGCPVLDIYSLNEVGPVGVFDAALGGHLLLQPQLFVEILDRDGCPVAAVQRGEIAVSGGFNFCLPLLRYRTGDHASLRLTADGPVLAGLSGRQPLRFWGRAGWLNNVDLTHALKHLPLSQFAVHQRADGFVILRLAADGARHADAARSAMAALFDGGRIIIEELNVEDKALQYSSDLPGAAA